MLPWPPSLPLLTDGPLSVVRPLGSPSIPAFFSPLSQSQYNLIERGVLTGGEIRGRPGTLSRPDGDMDRQGEVAAIWNEVIWAKCLTVNAKLWSIFR